MRITAPAKLNLRLAVLAREASGYHQIESVFCRVALADTLDIVKGAAPGIELAVHGGDVGAVEDNLVMRAARAFLETTTSQPQHAITLHKRIPAGAGLGGGSSDAAATLVALNRMHDEPLEPDALLALGARLGSDVPFFLADTALALVWGRGERMLTVPAPEPAPALVCVPAERVSTGDAYQRLGESRVDEPQPPLLSLDDLANWRSLARIACNDFERVVLPDIPALTTALALLRAHGAIIARLTGSGSAIFGIFENADARDAAERALGDAHPAMRLYPTDAAI